MKSNAVSPARSQTQQRLTTEARGVAPGRDPAQSVKRVAMEAER